MHADLLADRTQDQMVAMDQHVRNSISRACKPVWVRKRPAGISVKPGPVSECKASLRI
jgi:hypothetical protein